MRVVEAPGRRTPAAVWPVSQVLAAAIDLAAIDGDLCEVDGLVLGLARYRRGDGYVPVPGARRRYFDDNAWIGLCFAQLHLQTGDGRFLAEAHRLLAFVRGGEDANGGIRWSEGRTVRNTCSTAPAAELALRVHLAGGDPDAPAFARRLLAWLDETLRRPSGLYADHLDHRGTDETLWTYNQGSAAGAHALLHRATGDHDALDLASATARATLQEFDLERLRRQPPVFNAVCLRNLMVVDAQRPVPGLRSAVHAYLDHDLPEDAPAIDRAGIVQLLALQAWPKSRLANVC